VRILWLSHFLPYPPSGGALQRSHHLLRQAAREHEIHLVALNQRALLPSADAVTDAVRHLREICASVEVFPNAHDGSRARWAWMTATGFLRSTPYDVNWLEQPVLMAHLTLLALHTSFDLIHVDTIGMIPYASAFPGTPIVLNHHNVESVMMRRRSDRESGLRRLYCRRDAEKLEAIERLECGRAAVNVMVSALDAERLEAVVGRPRTAVVENGVDVEYFRPPAEGRPRPGALVFAGTMSWYPNQDAMRYFLQEVWPTLLAENPDRSLTVVGRNPPAEVLAAAQDSRVRAPGFVPDVRSYLAEASVYVCPIRDGGGTRLKVLDALAMAKPLVATKLSVEGLELDEESHYLRAETPEEFVRQIGRLERSPELARRLGDAGRRLVETRYSWDAIGRTLRGVYAAVRR
jgi:glycosyltransferase involved in cell wall biosynthesis